MSFEAFNYMLQWREEIYVNTENAILGVNANSYPVPDAKIWIDQLVKDMTEQQILGYQEKVQSFQNGFSPEGVIETLSRKEGKDDIDTILLYASGKVSVEMARDRIKEKQVDDLEKGLIKIYILESS